MIENRLGNVAYLKAVLLAVDLIETITSSLTDNPDPELAALYLSLLRLVYREVSGLVNTIGATSEMAG